MKRPFSGAGDLEAAIEAFRASLPPGAILDPEEEAFERQGLEVARRMARSGIPPRFSSGMPADGRVGRWAVGAGLGEPRNLVLTGRAGCGKTREACAALRVAAGRCTVAFTTFGDVLRAVRATYGGRGTEDEALSRYRCVSVLCVDDVGKERPTPDALEKLFALLDARYGRMKPTVFTTQYAMNDLGARLMAEGGDREQADAILRRMYQDAEVVELGR